MVWKCPACRGRLDPDGARLACGGCAHRYEMIGSIPDLRLAGASWLDHEADLRAARELLEARDGLTTEQVVRRILSGRPGWTDREVGARTAEVMGAPERLRREVRDWLAPAVCRDGAFLDLGCGPGMLLAAAAAEGHQGIGLDVSLMWLLAAERLVADWGGRPQLAAAMAETIPLEDASVIGVVSLDVIEHVDDPVIYLKEIDRVMKPGATAALSTPNRFSLSAEPHVSVWGVGWLPRRWQKRYVHMRSGKSYEYCRLLSTGEAVRLIRTHTRLEPKVELPPVPGEAMRSFSRVKGLLARSYNALSSLRPLRGLFLIVGPFFRILAQKRA